MALTGSERVKRWREKNRALYNLRRRGYRKKDLGSGLNAKNEVPKDLPIPPSASPVLPTPEVKVSSGKFPKMITLESLPKAEVAPPPTIYRNDYGAVITKAQWEKLQGIKERAKEGGYVIDEYSQ